MKCINEILFINYPRINKLTTYLNEMVKILNKLNLPVIWRLPNGLMVSQKYMVKHQKKIEPFSYLNNSLTLTITDKVKIDKNKQITALMPNLVHSLDATTLSLLYNSFYHSIDDNVNFYSVHDCYGVTAKHVDLLINLLRAVYVDLYSQKGYIQKFDSYIIETIISSYGEESCRYEANSRTIYIDKKKIKLPNVENIIFSDQKEKALESLTKSIFLVK